MAGEIPDEELLRGGAEGFATFYARHVDVVRMYLARRVRRADLTLDLVAETFARALHARERFDPARGPAIAWLLGIARNLLIDAARRGRVADETRRRLGLERAVVDPTGAFSGDDDTADLDPRESTVLRAALQRLPELQREAVLQRVVEEIPYDVMAERIGCSEQVVRKRVSRGLATIRRALEEQA